MKEWNLHCVGVDRKRRLQLLSVDGIKALVTLVIFMVIETIYRG